MKQIFLASGALALLVISAWAQASELHADGFHVYDEDICWVAPEWRE